MTPQTYADLAHENYTLLAALWRLAFDHVNIDDDYGGGERYTCTICGANDRSWGEAPAFKDAVHHIPGCALFGVDRTILAQLDAFDAMPEPV